MSLNWFRLSLQALMQNLKLKKLRREKNSAKKPENIPVRNEKYLNKLNAVSEALATEGIDAGPRDKETMARHLHDGRFVNLHHEKVAGHHKPEGILKEIAKVHFENFDRKNIGDLHSKHDEKFAEKILHHKHDDHDHNH